MITPVIITTTERILPWRRERLPVVGQETLPAQVAGLVPWQDSAVYIIATIWPLELLPRKSLSESKKNCWKAVPAIPPQPVRRCFRGDLGSLSPLVRVENPLPAFLQVHE